MFCRTKPRSLASICLRSLQTNANVQSPLGFSFRENACRLPRSQGVTAIVDSRVTRLSLTPSVRKYATESDSETAQVSATKIEKPNPRQLKELFIASAIPFIGFGFFDNFVMIIAGDMIDITLCATLCFSTMAAAAIGNAISDVVGIYAGGVVEQVADRLGIREPPLSSEQRLLPMTKVWQYTGQVVGILIGCFLGACPLLFLDLQEATRRKKLKELEAMLNDAMPDIQRIVKAEAVMLMKLDGDNLVCLNATKNLPNVQPWKIEHGIMGHVAKTGHFVNTANVPESPLYYPPLHDNFQGKGFRFRSILCIPVLKADSVIGVLTAINKENNGAFTTRDEDALSFISSHISVRMDSVLDVEHSFKDVLVTCERVIAKQESIEFARTARQRRMDLYLPALDGISRVLQAQATALMLLDTESTELYTEAIVGDLPKHKNKLGEGIAGRCASQGRTINVLRNVEDEESLFNKERHDDYLGSGMTVWSELVVPIFDSARKCIGVIKVINKQGGRAFDTEDTEFVTEVANDLGIMLEDDGGVKRVLVLARQQLQNRAVAVASRADHHTVLLYLEKGQNLPNNADVFGVGIDPYITVRIVRGDPTEDLGMQKAVMKARDDDRNEVAPRFAKSKCIKQNLNPCWEETVAVSVPIHLRGVPEEELYAHVMLWDYDAWKDDDLIGQAVFNLASMPAGKLEAAKPCHLQTVPGITRFNLDETMLWLSFSKGSKPLAKSISPPLLTSTKKESKKDDWAGDTYVPKVGQAAVDTFESADCWLGIVDSVRHSLTNSCGVSIEDLEKTREDKTGGPIVCAVSDPRQLDCPLVYISKGFENLTGYPRSFALGRNCRFLQPNNRKENDLVNKIDRVRMQQFVQGKMPEGYVLWNLLLNETFDGRKFWNVLRMEFVYLGEERKPYIFAVQREFKNAPKSLTEVAGMRVKLAEHEKNGTVPRDVLHWAGLN